MSAAGDPPQPRPPGLVYLAEHAETGALMNPLDGRRGQETVATTVELEMLGWAEQVTVTLSWSSDAPYAVGLIFPGELEVCWLVARDLLAAGLLGPSGLGDVSVFPDLYDPGFVELVLSSPDGSVGLRMPVHRLATFLDATWRHVPAGAEAQPS